MTYREYRARGYRYADYRRLSQWQRWRGVWQDWRGSRARDKGLQCAALWDADDESRDWCRVWDWWHPRRWGLWRFGIDQCQNFHRINLGPAVVLVAT